MAPPTHPNSTHVCDTSEVDAGLCCFTKTCAGLASRYSCTALHCAGFGDTCAPDKHLPTPLVRAQDLGTSPSKHAKCFVSLLVSLRPLVLTKLDLRATARNSSPL